MNGLRIQHLLTLDSYAGPIYAGISSVDFPLPELKKGNCPSLVVLNTAPVSSPGEHWCVAYFRPPSSKNGRVCEFYDPYGMSPLFYNFTSLLGKCNKIIYNQMKVQGDLSTTCGLHCLFYSLLRARGFSSNEIMLRYDPDNLRKNDNMVHEYIKGQYGSVFADVFSV